MKNWFLLVLLSIFAPYSFSMEECEIEATDTTVLFKGRHIDNTIAAFLWEKMKGATIVDIEKERAEVFIIDPKRNIHMYGSFLSKEAFKDALEKVGLGGEKTNRTVSLMLKKNDKNYDDLLSKHHLDVQFIDPTEVSYLRPTWERLSNEKPTDGLTLLDQGYTTNPSRNSLAVREYFTTESGSLLEQKRDIFWVVVDANKQKLNFIIERGEAYLAKMESIERATVDNAQLEIIKEKRIVCANVITGWDRLTSKLLNKEFDGLRPHMVIFFKYLGKIDGKRRYQVGLRSNDPELNVANIARSFGDQFSGWQNGHYSEGGFDTTLDIGGLLDHFENNGFYTAPIRS